MRGSVGRFFICVALAGSLTGVAAQSASAQATADKTAKP